MNHYVNIWDNNKAYHLENPPIINPISGETIYFLRPSNQKILSFLWVIEANKKMPFAHIHRYQTETFWVMEGVCKMILSNQTVYVQAGEKFTVEPGQAHQPANPSVNNRLVVLVTVKPRLDFRVNLETIFGLASEGKCNSKGIPSIWQLLVMHYKYPQDYLAGMPYVIQDALAKLLGPLLQWFGIKPCYERFSGGNNSKTPH